MIAKCICKNDYQDKKYGQGKRVHSPCKLPDKSLGIRCIVCGKEKPTP